MRAIIWIIVLALVVWGIWWFVTRDNTAGIPATGGETSGQVEGASDSYLDASSTGSSTMPAYDGKG